MKRVNWKAKNVGKASARPISRILPVLGALLPILIGVAGCVSTPEGKKFRPGEALRRADMRFNTWLDDRVGFETDSDAARRASTLSTLP